MATLREILAQRTELRVVSNEVYCNWDELLKQFPAYGYNLPNCKHLWRKINYLAFEIPHEKDLNIEIIKQLANMLDSSIPSQASGIRVGAYERAYTFKIPGRELKKSDSGTFFVFSRE